MLVIERDRAEDRLKIEQTQRDSVERLRQRNKELEEQLRLLCESQVSGWPYRGKIGPGHVVSHIQDQVPRLCVV